MFFKMGRSKYILYLPVFVFLILQNKRVINMSLAYDISFRPGYFYYQKTYINNLPNLFNNKIEIKSSRKADIYLNCAVPSMSYYVVSPFNYLPVANIDRGAYKILTDNDNYMSKQGLVVGKKFVTIAAKTGLNTEYNSCVANLKFRGWTIEAEEEVLFVGSSSQKLVVIWGEIK